MSQNLSESSNQDSEQDHKNTMRSYNLSKIPLLSVSVLIPKVGTFVMLQLTPVNYSILSPSMIHVPYILRVDCLTGTTANGTDD